MTKDLISVIIPVYNAEKYLDKCLESVTGQTYKNLEIILVDDGSPDGSGEICDKWAETDNRIRVIHKKNGGVSSARNTALDLISGEFVTFVDSDDLIEADMYELLTDLIKTYDADISHCGYKRVNPDGSVIKEVSGTHKLMVDNKVEALTNLVMGRYYVSSVCNKLFKAKLFDDIRFDESIRVNEDTLICFKAFQKAKIIVFKDECMYNYIMYPESATHSIDYMRFISDCNKVAQIMYDANTDKELESVIHSRLYSSKANLYKYYLKNGIDKNKEKELKKWLKENFGNFKGVRIRTKIAYIMLIYMSGLYFKVYKIYLRYRKGNIDVRTK